MTMLGPLLLPKALSAAGEHLTKAVREVEVLGVWPDGTKFEVAAQPKAIAQALIGVLHTHLANARIEYLYRETLAKGGRLRLGVASRASAKLAYLAEVDFLLEFNWSTWGKLSPPQRIALVDHELSHCGRDSDSGNWVTIRCDVEEFAQIVLRWGLWTPDLRVFSAAMAGAQKDLFKDEPVATEASRG